MIRRLALHIMIGCCALGAAAQDAPGLSAAKAFAEAPERVVPMLTRNTRMDMLDYFQAGSTKASKNTIGGECMLVGMSPYDLEYTISGATRGELFVLNPLDNCPVIAVVETIDTPIPDSRARFYDCRWNELRKTPLRVPGIDEWLTPEGQKQRKQVEEVIPFIMAQYSYDPASAVLTLTNTTAQYFVASEIPAEMKLLHQQLRYQWNGKQFKLIEK